MIQAKQDLLHCPFCGSSAKIIADERLYQIVGCAKDNPELLCPKPNILMPKIDGKCDYSYWNGRANGDLSVVRELLAEAYVELSGKEIHASDCATSVSPAETPGRCNCNYPLETAIQTQITNANGEAVGKLLALNLRALIKEHFPQNKDKDYFTESALQNFVNEMLRL